MYLGKPIYEDAIDAVTDDNQIWKYIGVKRWAAEILKDNGD
jgi:hypothetical protein